MSDAYQHLYFTIPTYRCNDIAATVTRYAHNFAHYNHTVPIMVFDDSSRKNARVSEGSLRVAARTLDFGQEIFYVGPHEKEASLVNIKKHFGRDERPVIDDIFRPSYGGNRNWILAYTFGGHFISVDDDMSPEGLFLHGDHKGLQDNVIAQGRFLDEHESPSQVFIGKQDIIRGYTSFIGTQVKEHKGKVPFGHDLRDSNTDPIYNSSRGDLEESVITLTGETISDEAFIKVVQSHLTGDADVDSEDLMRMFMDTGLDEILAGHLPKKFILEEMRGAVTSNNMRLTGAMLGYDNSSGGVFFLPTTLRCEDFIWRVFLANHDDIACAYTPHAQTHRRALSVRQSIVQDWYNELLAKLIKERILRSVDKVGTSTISFHDPDPITQEEANTIEDLVRQRHRDATERARFHEFPGPYLSMAGELDSIIGDNIGPSTTYALRLTNTLQQELVLYNNAARVWERVLDWCSSHHHELSLVNITAESKK
jgi:hypothetical protein